jgi:hypothetical protein
VLVHDVMATGVASKNARRHVATIGWGCTFGEVALFGEEKSFGEDIGYVAVCSVVTEAAKGGMCENGTNLITHSICTVVIFVAQRAWPV